MTIKEWDLSLIEFVVKFCKDEIKLKLKFRSVEDDDFILKTLIINNDTYIPDALRHEYIGGIYAEDGYIVLIFDAILKISTVDDLKQKGYKFDPNESVDKLYEWGLA